MCDLDNNHNDLKTYYESLSTINETNTIHYWYKIKECQY